MVMFSRIGHSKNGFRNVFSEIVASTPLGKGGMVVKYEWDGRDYQEVARLIPPEELQYVQDSIRQVMLTEPNGQNMARELQNYADAYGEHAIISSFTGSDQVMNQLSQQLGVDPRLYETDPKQFEAEMFGKMVDNILINPSNPGLAVGVLMARSIDRQMREREQQNYQEPRYVTAPNGMRIENPEYREPERRSNEPTYTDRYSGSWGSSEVERTGRRPSQPQSQPDLGRDLERGANQAADQAGRAC